MKRFTGKTVVITGGGSGIGAASAKLFATEGANVVVADLNPEDGEEIVKQILESDGTAIFCHANIAKSADIAAMVQKAETAFGRIDVLFNNAGILGKPLDGLTEKQWRKELDIMLTGPFLASQAVIQIMRNQRGGVILNTGSVASFIAGGSSPGYTAAKGGLLMLTKYLAKVLAPENIRVNMICPGAINTGITDALWGRPETEEEKAAINRLRCSRIPMERPGEAEEVANVALFLASDDASYITGAAVPVDGGMLA